MPHVLIIESEASAAECLAALIAAQGCSVATVPTLLGARAQVALHAPDLVLLEAALLETAGLFALDELRILAAQAQFVLMGQVGPAAQTPTETTPGVGATVVPRPVSAQSLRGLLSRLERPAAPSPQATTAKAADPSGPASSGEAARLHETLEREGHFGQLWGRSGVMRRVYEQIVRVSGTGVPVFLLGESGSGKELVARMVHDLSARSARAFLGVNCGAISSQLIESELFGHEKGSFTGAERQHQGFFERASGGTLFLDEITEMPLDLQVKLLRVLETGTFMRVGSMQVQQSNVRLIAASNRPPAQALAEGHLREDLLYRLNVFPIEMPTLRERPEDIALLANHFLDDICEREGQARRFSAEALARLCHYHWPGNVRELRNIVQRAYVMAQGELIHDACLPAHDAARMAPRAGISAQEGGPLLTVEIGTALSEIEREVTLATLVHYRHHKERTAAALGVSLKTLYNRLKEYSSPPDLMSSTPRGTGQAHDHGASFLLPATRASTPYLPVRSAEQ